MAGTGVTVQRIVGWYKLGLTPEEIADRVGHLSLAHVYAALAYSHANQEEIEANIVDDDTQAKHWNRHTLTVGGLVRDGHEHLNLATA